MLGRNAIQSMIENKGKWTGFTPTQVDRLLRSLKHPSDSYLEEFMKRNLHSSSTPLVRKLSQATKIQTKEKLMKVSKWTDSESIFNFAFFDLAGLVGNYNTGIRGSQVVQDPVLSFLRKKAITLLDLTDRSNPVWLDSGITPEEHKRQKIQRHRLEFKQDLPDKRRWIDRSIVNPEVRKNDRNERSKSNLLKELLNHQNPFLSNKITNRAITDKFLEIKDRIRNLDTVLEQEIALRSLSKQEIAILKRVLLRN